MRRGTRCKIREQIESISHHIKWIPKVQYISLMSPTLLYNTRQTQNSPICLAPSIKESRRILMCNLPNLGDWSTTGVESHAFSGMHDDT
jgi:hypothetical protein